MKLKAAILALLASGCSVASTSQWRPMPVRTTEPADVIGASTVADWQAIADEDLLVMDLGDGGRVTIQLAPDFAPVHVANIRAFARSGWWNNATIYRVQDNYVVQWGNGDAEVPLPTGVTRTPPAEYERAIGTLAVEPHAYPDAYAPRTGHAAGWPVAFDPAAGTAWLPHCYGTVGVGRDLAPDTGTGGELYAVIGHSPRQLDRNIANVGRVIDGMSVISARPRGTGNLGFYQTDRGERPIPIARIRIASDMPVSERPKYEFMRTDSNAFRQYVLGRANRGGTFFNVQAGGVDICNAPVPVRRRAS